MMELMTKCEEMVMSVIWDKGEEESLLAITEAVNRRFDQEWKSQTVSTFLTRLRGKGYLECYRIGRVFYYKVLVSKEDYLRQKVAVLCYTFAITKEDIANL